MAVHYRNHYCNSPRYCCNNQYFWGFYHMTKYICQICGHEYDPQKGEPTQNIPKETPFPALTADWSCPVCGAEKKFFREA
jgi:rubredoxin